MKNPAEYVEAAHAKQPIALGPQVPFIVAQRAVEAALADAERYRNLLMRALRRADSSTPAADVATPAP
jgi:hypothetical protein